MINVLERREIVTSIFTFFGALFFVNDEVSEQIKLTILVIILGLNIWFFTLWLYIALLSTKYEFLRKLSRIFKAISMISLYHDDSEFSIIL